MLVRARPSIFCRVCRELMSPILYLYVYAYCDWIHTSSNANVVQNGMMNLIFVFICSCYVVVKLDLLLQEEARSGGELQNQETRMNGGKACCGVGSRMLPSKTR